MSPVRIEAARLPDPTEPESCRYGRDMIVFGENGGGGGEEGDGSDDGDDGDDGGSGDDGDYGDDGDNGGDGATVTLVERPPQTGLDS